MGNQTWPQSWSTCLKPSSFRSGLQARAANPLALAPASPSDRHRRGRGPGADPGGPISGEGSRRRRLRIHTSHRAAPTSPRGSLTAPWAALCLSWRRKRLRQQHWNHADPGRPASELTRWLAKVEYTRIVWTTLLLVVTDHDVAKQMFSRLQEQ